MKKYTSPAQNLTGASNQKLERQIRNNKLVVIWIPAMHGFSVHAIVIIGFNDP